MKLTRRQSIKAIASVLGSPFLLRGGEVLAADKFMFSETLTGRVCDGIYDFERGFEIAEKKGTGEISYEGSIVIDDLGAFKDDQIHRARFEGKVIYNGEKSEIDMGKVKFLVPADNPEWKLRRLIYLLPFSSKGVNYVLSGYKDIRLLELNALKAMEAWTTLYTHLHKGTLEGPLESPVLGPMLGAGIMKFHMEDIGDFLKSCEPKFPEGVEFLCFIFGEAFRELLGL